MGWWRSVHRQKILGKENGSPSICQCDTCTICLLVR